MIPSVQRQLSNDPFLCRHAPRAEEAKDSAKPYLEAGFVSRQAMSKTPFFWAGLVKTSGSGETNPFSLSIAPSNGKVCKSLVRPKSAPGEGEAEPVPLVLEPACCRTTGRS